MSKQTIISIIIVIIAILLVYLLLGYRTKTASQESMSPVSTDRQTSELQIQILQEGEGKGAQAGDTVTVNYTGTLSDGTQFDSSLDHGVPFIFELGTGKVIPGWDQGLLGMKVGEKRHLIIPPDLAYGSQGVPPVIPPNATLIFDVEMLGIQ